MTESKSAASAIRKLEELFERLEPHERKVISEMVRASLVQAAERFESEDEGGRVPEFVAGITGHNAPNLVKSLQFPGSLAAHSIPGCNASALAAIRREFGS